MAYSIDLDRPADVRGHENAPRSHSEDLWTAGRALFLIAVGSGCAWGIVMYLAIR